MKLLFVSLMLFLGAVSYAQETKKLELDTMHFIGKYTGKNLFVKNPFNSDGEKGFTVQSVILDKEPMEVNFKVSAFEVNFNEREKKIGDDLNLVIIHIKGFVPEILNLEVIDEK